MLIPETYIMESLWNTSNTASGGYLNSTIHTTTLPTIANNLKTVLGDHLVNRRVLLSSSVDGDGLANAYTWTTAYCTLPSVGQLTGTFAQHNNKYDDGEANYKLPLFDHMDYKSTYSFWLRGVQLNKAWHIDRWGSGLENPAGIYKYVRPLIYIR